MTTTPTDSVERMEAGRALDKRIAEEVMGWRFNYGWWTAQDGENVWIANYWSPSTSIQAAWQVVEKMGAEWHAVVRSPFQDGEPYWAGFTTKGCTGWNGRPDHQASADTAPLAICRAALKAMEAGR